MEQTIHHLINAGMRLASNKCRYRGFIYTVFQQRATAFSHGNTARRAKALGDTSLAKVCVLAPCTGMAVTTVIRNAGELFVLTERARTHRTQKRECFRRTTSQRFSDRSCFLFIRWLQDSAVHDLPATPVHAALCPPKARGRFYIRAWQSATPPHRERSTALVFTPKFMQLLNLGVQLENEKQTCQCI